MVFVGKIKLELYLFVLISLLAYSTGLQTNNLDDLHNQLNDNQQVSSNACNSYYIAIYLSL